MGSNNLQKTKELANLRSARMTIANIEVRDLWSTAAPRREEAGIIEKASGCADLAKSFGARKKEWELLSDNPAIGRVRSPLSTRLSAPRNPHREAEVAGGASPGFKCLRPEIFASRRRYALCRLGQADYLCSVESTHGLVVSPLRARRLGCADQHPTIESD